MPNRNHPFFINIMPANDRREDLNYPSTLEKVISQAKHKYFLYTLITSGPMRFDPWSIAEMGLQKNAEFSPLIALNPASYKEQEVMKKIDSLKSHKDSFALNLIPGSFLQDAKFHSAKLTYQEKAQRVLEFASGLDPSIELFFSGVDSPSFNGYFVKSIKPLEEMRPAPSNKHGLLLGVCARPTSMDAKEAFDKLYPEDRKGQMLFELAASNLETNWPETVSNYVKENKHRDPHFNLVPMMNLWSGAPFLYGDYNEVAQVLKEYTDLGYGFFILDFHPDDFHHVHECLDQFQKIRS